MPWNLVSLLYTIQKNTPNSACTMDENGNIEHNSDLCTSLFEIHPKMHWD